MLRLKRLRWVGIGKSPPPRDGSCSEIHQQKGYESYFFACVFSIALDEFMFTFSLFVNC